MTYFQRLKAARKEFGISATRPQDEYVEFLKHLRRLNNGIGIWQDWPKATEAIRERIKLSQLPNLVFNPPESDDLGFVPFTLIENRDDFLDMMNDIRQQEVISLDYEFHKEHSYNGLIALVQVATRSFNYVIDPFITRNELLEFFVPEIIENPTLLKVMCGCDNDCLMTQSNFASFLTTVIDVQDIYNYWKLTKPEDCFEVMKKSFYMQLVEEEKINKNLDDFTLNAVIRAEWEKNQPVSYKKLMNALYNQNASKIDKVAELADFRVRPLGKLAEYAAKDVHFLLSAFWKLSLKISSDDMATAFQRSKIKLRKTFSLQKYPTSKSMLENNVNVHNPSDVELFQRIHAWRDEIAKAMDENPEIIMMPDEMETLAKLSTLKNLTLSKLEIILKQNTCRFTTMQFRRIIAIVNGDNETLQAIVKRECHNCHGQAHQGWQCPFPVDPSKCRIWMNRPENWRAKMKQSKRRAINWFNKTGRWPDNAPMHWLDELLEEDAYTD